MVSNQRMSAFELVIVSRKTWENCMVAEPRDYLAAQKCGLEYEREKKAVGFT